MTGSDRKIVSSVIKTGSYTGIGLLALGFFLELMSSVVRIQPGVLHDLSLSGIVILIFTPVGAMISLSVHFAATRQWKWAAAAGFAGILIAATFVLIRS